MAIGCRHLTRRGHGSRRLLRRFPIGSLYREDGQWQYTDAGWYWQRHPTLGAGQPFIMAVGITILRAAGFGNRTTVGLASVGRVAQNIFPCGLRRRCCTGVRFNAAFAVQLNNLAGLWIFLPVLYTFVPTGNFLSHNLVKHAASAVNRVATMLLSASVPVKNHGFGIPPEEIAAATLLYDPPVICRL